MTSSSHSTRKNHIIVLTVRREDTSRNAVMINTYMRAFLGGSGFDLNHSSAVAFQYPQPLIDGYDTILVAIASQIAVSSAQIATLDQRFWAWFQTPPTHPFTYHRFNTTDQKITCEQTSCTEANESRFECICDLHRMRGYPLVSLEMQHFPYLRPYLGEYHQSRYMVNLTMPNTPKITEKRVIFVKNVPHYLHNNVDQVTNFMGHYGRPIKVFFIKNRDKKTWVLVEYRTPQIAQQSKVYYNGRSWDGRPITVQDADEDFLPEHASVSTSNQPQVADGGTR